MVDEAANAGVLATKTSDNVAMSLAKNVEIVADRVIVFTVKSGVLRGCLWRGIMPNFGSWRGVWVVFSRQNCGQMLRRGETGPTVLASMTVGVYTGIEALKYWGQTIYSCIHFHR